MYHFVQRRLKVSYERVVKTVQSFPVPLSLDLGCIVFQPMTYNASSMSLP